MSKTEITTTQNPLEEIEGNKQSLIFQTQDGLTRIQVELEEETVWLTQEQMSILFGKGRTTITEHIRNIFLEGELQESKVCRKFRHTTQHGAIDGLLQTRQAVKRNIERFPDDFMFQLTKEEFDNWKSQIVTSNWMSQNATSNSILKGARKCPYAFTENGIAMLSGC